MTTWEQLVRQRAKRFAHVPPLDKVERIVTVCVEEIVTELNVRLARVQGNLISYPMIPAEKALNTIDADGKFSDLGIYAPVIMQVADECLRHERSLSPSQKQYNDDMRQGLENLATLLPKDAATSSVRTFIDKFPQLRRIGFGNEHTLYEFIQKQAGEIAQDALKGKPSRRMQQPPSGHFER